LIYHYNPSVREDHTKVFASIGIFDQLAAQLSTQAGKAAGGGTPNFSLSQGILQPGNQQTATALGLILPEALAFAGLAPFPGSSPFNIDQFRTNLDAHREVAKVDKYDVQIMLPIILNQYGTASDLLLQCEAAEFPGRDVTMIEYRHYAFIRRIPHMNQYGQAGFTFYCAGDMWEKKMFDQWLEAMIPTNTGLVSYPEDDSGAHRYDTSIYVNQYDMTGALQYQVKLEEAMPTSISPLATNWATDDIHRLTVNFVFKKWSTVDTTNSTTNPLGTVNNFVNGEIQSILPGAPKINLGIF